MTIDLTGKIAIVTGPTSGIGFETALALAGMGATTILAARNFERATLAIRRIRSTYANAAVSYQRLDLASLASVAEFANAQTEADILINNGAVMALPTRQTTEDGFEQQIGVNYLAHFALTLRLLPKLRSGARVVNVASLAHRRAALDLDDLNAARAYDPMGAYRQSKLAMLMFSLELARRLRADSRGIRSIAAHPGWSRTNIIPNGYGPGPRAWIAGLIFNSVAQSARAGALPVIYAATAEEAEAGGYYGPRFFGETRGAPSPSVISSYASDEQVAARLWALSERLTGVIPDSCG